MSIEMVPVRNTDTGQVGVIRRDWLDHPVINKDGILVEVDADAKSYVPELYKSKGKLIANKSDAVFTLTEAKPEAKAKAEPKEEKD